MTTERITKEDFERFWNNKGRYLNNLERRNPERLLKKICQEIESRKTVSGLDEYVCTLRQGKESTRKIVVSFYEYLEQTAGFSKIESCLYEKRFYDDPLERQLEIAKYLHEKRTPREIQEHFSIDERTMRKDLQALEEGITVFGSTIRIIKEREGRRYYYRSTLHPVFLPLNLTEIYALTVYLERVIRRNNPNREIIQDIVQRIKAQLSDYAYQKLYPEEERIQTRNSYVNDKELAQQREGIRMYLMKSGRPCSFFWENQKYRGMIKWGKEGYYIKLENGETLAAKLEDVDFIIDSLEYR